MQQQDKLIFVGFISSCFGIKGEVIIKSFTEPSTNICKLPIFNEKGEKLELKLVKRNSKGDLICKLNDIQDRTIAEEWLKTKLFCRRSNLPAPQSDEHYIEDLKGVKIINELREEIGVIRNIFNFGAGDIIEIEFKSGEIEMFPFKKEFFPEITSEYAVFTREE